MMLSVQRQCDGTPDDATCEERLELVVSVPDPVTVEASKQFTNAWEAAAAGLGWRRADGPGITRVGAIEGMQYAVPSAMCWVVCAKCTKLLGLLCRTCGKSECFCAEMGGPRFDARRP